MFSLLCKNFTLFSLLAGRSFVLARGFKDRLACGCGAALNAGQTLGDATNSTRI